MPLVPVTLSVSPSTFTVSSISQQTQSFQVLVNGNPLFNPAWVTWSLQSEAILPLQPGGIDGSGNPTPPLTPTPFQPISGLQELIGTIDQSGNYTAPSSLSRNTPVHNLVVATFNTNFLVNGIQAGITTVTAELILLNENFVVWTDPQGKRGEQWFFCNRCGNPYPMSQLTQQKGILVCLRYCWDDLTVERRPQFIQRVLTTSQVPLPEMSDRRAIDQGWFIIDVEVG